MNKKNSIYVQLLRLLLLAALAAFSLFYVLNYVGENALNDFYDNSGYEEKKNEKYIKKLQQYIEVENLVAEDSEMLSLWVKEQKVISIYIYKDDRLIFDSNYPQKDVWAENISFNDYGWVTYYTVQFADEEAKVNILGAYSYQFYNYATIAELILSTIVFLTIVLLGVRSKMKYIWLLSQEIEILEGGSLDYAITIKGKDELSALAEGIDNMRRSFCELIRQETELVQENQRIVTEMSHDIRTPITSIMLYTEILKKKNYRDEAQLEEYVEKIDQKARRMKQLTDHLFEYSLIAGKNEIVLEDAESYQVLFYDLFSETVTYLQQRGFAVETRMEEVNRTLHISTDYMMRIMDNITSNLVKYADNTEPIVFCVVQTETMAGFCVQNKVRVGEERVESTGIGLQSIRNMMAKMGGKSVVENENGNFTVTILFPSKPIKDK